MPKTQTSYVPLTICRFQRRLRNYMVTNILGRHCHLPSSILHAVRQQVTRGKLVRPTTSFLVAKMLGTTKREKTMMPCLAALELVHRSTLIHDDIADRAEERNGIPCIHVTHGLATALYVANLIQNLGISLCPSSMRDSLNDVILDLYRGQLGESIVHAEGIFRERMFHDYENIAWLKSGNLGEFAILMGAYLADDTPPRNSHQLARSLGLAYQMCNDLEEFHRWLSCNDPQIVIPDVRNRTRTLPMLLLWQTCRSNFLKKYLASRPGDSIPRNVRLLATQHDPRSKVASMIRKILEEASNVLALWPDNTYRVRFSRLALRVWPQLYAGAAGDLISVASKRSAKP